MKEGAFLYCDPLAEILVVEGEGSPLEIKEGMRGYPLPISGRSLLPLTPREKSTLKTSWGRTQMVLKKREEELKKENRPLLNEPTFILFLRLKHADEQEKLSLLSVLNRRFLLDKKVQKYSSEYLLQQQIQLMLTELALLISPENDVASPEEYFFQVSNLEGFWNSFQDRYNLHQSTSIKNLFSSITSKIGLP